MNEHRLAGVHLSAITKGGYFCTKVQLGWIVWLPYSGYRDDQRRPR
jgi:hypothetical protein